MKVQTEQYKEALLLTRNCTRYSDPIKGGRSVKVFGASLDVHDRLRLLADKVVFTRPAPMGSRTRYYFYAA